MTALLALLERFLDRAVLALIIWGSEVYRAWAEVRPGEEDA